MAVQGGFKNEGISSMLIERMSDIRDTYQAEKKKRLERQKAIDPRVKSDASYRTYKSGQINYKKSKED